MLLLLLLLVLPVLLVLLVLLLTEAGKAKEPKREKINGIRTDLQVSESICINAVGPVGDHKRGFPARCCACPSPPPSLSLSSCSPYKRTTKPLRYFGFDKQRRRRRLSYLSNKTQQNIRLKMHLQLNSINFNRFHSRPATRRPSPSPSPASVTATNLCADRKRSLEAALGLGYVGCEMCDAVTGLAPVHAYPYHVH